MDCFTNGGSNIGTNEGNTDPWDSAITDLTAPAGIYSYPTHALTYSRGLADSCTDHVYGKGPCASTGHTGLDGSSASGRSKRYISGWGTGENLAYAQYGDFDGEDVIIQFIVDDGVLS